MPLASRTIGSANLVVVDTGSGGLAPDFDSEPVYVCASSHLTAYDGEDGGVAACSVYRGTPLLCGLDPAITSQSYAVDSKPKLATWNLVTVQLPFAFSLESKSDQGWGFVGPVESGRYKEYQDKGAEETRRFWAQVVACSYSADIASPNKIMRWSVPESKGHDDPLVSAALVAVLDQQDWTPRTAVGRVQ